LKAIYSTIDFNEDESDTEIFPLDYAWMTMRFVLDIGAISFFLPKSAESSGQKPFLKLSFEVLKLNLEQRPTSNHMKLDLKTLV